MIALLTFGCAQNYYNIPRESYERKVRVLGVAPIFTDGDSDIRHPEREALTALVKDFNRKNDPELVARLKDTGVYLSVRMPEGDADQLFSSLFFRRERRSDAGVIYNKYFYKQQELKELIDKNSVDAIMLVVVSGLTRPDKLYSSNYLAFLDTDYNFLTITAQILDAEGNILWEYPNFQKRILSLTPLLNLQFADFDEAEANVTDKVDVKFKTIPGIARALGKTTSSSVQKDAKVSKLYGPIFDEMVSMLKPEFKFPWEKSSEVKAEQTRTEPQPYVPVAPKPQPKVERVEPAKVKLKQADPEPEAVTADPVPPAPGEIATETLK